MLKAIIFSLVLASGFYPMTGKITDVDRSSDIVTITDYNGESWQFYGVEDYEVDDFVSCIMYDCGTETIYDDCIVPNTMRYARVDF